MNFEPPPVPAWVARTLKWVAWPFPGATVFPERRAAAQLPYRVLKQSGSRLSPTRPARMVGPLDQDSQTWILPAWAYLADALWFDTNVSKGVAFSTLERALKWCSEQRDPAEAAAALQTIHLVDPEQSKVGPYLDELEALNPGIPWEAAVAMVRWVSPTRLEGLVESREGSMHGVIPLRRIEAIKRLGEALRPSGFDRAFVAFECFPELVRWVAEDYARAMAVATVASVHVQHLREGTGSDLGRQIRELVAGA